MALLAGVCLGLNFEPITSDMAEERGSTGLVVFSRLRSCRLTVRRTTAAMSQLSYAPSLYPDLAPAEAVQRLLREQTRNAEMGGRDASLSDSNRAASRAIAARNANLDVVRASPDVVALRDRRTGEMFFSFRGTRCVSCSFPLCVRASAVAYISGIPSYKQRNARRDSRRPNYGQRAQHPSSQRSAYVCVRRVA